jgi:hypothetical protein
VKRTIFFTAFLSLLGMGMICLASCGSNHLRTIQLTAPQNNLYGIGATIQLQAQGTYAYGPNQDLTNKVTYTIIADPDSLIAMPTPPQTAMINSTGLVTAVDPAVCAWEDVGTLTTPAWAETGNYQVTASYRGVTSQPVFIGVASGAGPSGPPANGQCGPLPTGTL